MNTNWYAVYTKPRWEKKVAEILTRKEIQNYCPLNKVLKKWHDRKKIIMEPLFTSYVFVQVMEKQLTDLKRIDGIISVLYWLGKPAVIRENEIDAIKSFMNDYEHVSLEKVNVRVNDKVKIIHGPLETREGIVLEVFTHTIKVFLPSLGYSMLAQVHRSDIKLSTQVVDDFSKLSETY